jgi:2-alkenal reductase
MVIALLAFSAGWLWAPYLPSLPELVSGLLARPASPEEAALAQLYQQVLPSVVSVKGIGGSRPAVEAGDEAAAGPGQGSGFIWDNAGHIVTNLNVVQAAQCIEVMLADGAQVGAEVVGRDISTNLAVLKIDLPPERLQPVSLGDSSRLAVDQPVMAISAPPGETLTMINGLISSLDRTMDGCDSCYPIAEVIQAEIGLQPEDAGGPLFNAQGEVIGVNTWIMSRGETGVSFALPVKAIEQFIPVLIGND